MHYPHIATTNTGAHPEADDEAAFDCAADGDTASRPVSGISRTLV